MTLTYTLYSIAFLLGMYIYNKLSKRINDPKFLVVDIATLKFDKSDVPLQDDKGKYIMQLVKKGYKLKIPIMLNSDDDLIRPPFLEVNGKLWVVHSILQLNNRVNVVVLPAGEPTEEKSPFCYNATKMEVVK